MVSKKLPLILRNTETVIKYVNMNIVPCANTCNDWVAVVMYYMFPSDMQNVYRSWQVNNNFSFVIQYLICEFLV